MDKLGGRRILKKKEKRKTEKWLPNLKYTTQPPKFRKLFQNSLLSAENILMFRHQYYTMCFACKV